MFVLLAFMKAYGQEASVEKSLWGVQVGIHPLSVHNESKLSESLSLRSELGFGFGFSGDSWAVMPEAVVEPRLYYNLKRRMKLGKQIENNSGNYLSLLAGYTLGDAAINSEDVKVYSSFSLIPMYGLRRNMGAHFNFEFAIGLGYGWVFKEDTYSYAGNYTVKKTEHGLMYGMRLAIGYVF